jgi:hypothetical protein
VSLDIFGKLANLKANSNDSALFFLARLAEHRDDRLLRLSESWVALWAAADISFKQLCGDVGNLDTLVNKMNTEFTRIKDSKDNVGLDGKMEDMKGPATNPLHRRLNVFLLAAKPRIAQIRTQLKTVEAAIELEMCKYGDTLKKVSDEDASKAFFSSIATFARGFRAAADELAARKAAAEKAAAKTTAANDAAAAKSPGGGGGGAGMMASLAAAAAVAAKAKQDNIFAGFHSAQEASSDDVIAEFKRKMAKRAAASA